MTTDSRELPKRMTWEELEQLPPEIAGEIELWDGEVVWLRRAPAEHQVATNLLWSGIRRSEQTRPRQSDDQCYAVATESNVFFGNAGKSSYLTPDFLVYKCIPEFSDIRTPDVVLVGEVLSPSNRPGDVEARKFRYASAGIPWYWEVTLAEGPARIASIRSYALETGHGQLPTGVKPLRPANFILINEWTPTDEEIATEYPFPIRITWGELRF